MTFKGHIDRDDLWTSREQFSCQIWITWPKKHPIDIHDAKFGILRYIWPSKVILKVLKVTRMTFERAYGHFRAVFGFLDHKNLPIDIHDAKLRVFRCTWPLKVILKVPKVKGWPLIGEDVLVTRAFDFWSIKCA